MLCEIPASSYKPAHLVSLSLVSDVFMDFPKSANRRREEFVRFHCTCSNTLLWLISAALLSRCTLLIKHYYVCTKSGGLRTDEHLCHQARDPYHKVPPGGALALYIRARSVWQEGRLRQSSTKCCPSAPASEQKVRAGKNNKKI